MRYAMRYTEFKLSLVQGLAAMGQFGKGMTLVDETIALVEASGELLYMPEALRVKGSVLLSMPQRRAHEAQLCFMQSLDWSRRQDARSWELRTAIDLARLWGRTGKVRKRLRGSTADIQPVRGRFGYGGSEGSRTVAGDTTTADGYEPSIAPRPAVSSREPVSATSGSPTIGSSIDVLGAEILPSMTSIGTD